MKKFICMLAVIYFSFHYINANAKSSECTHNGNYVIDTLDDFYYEIGQEIPDLKKYITVRDSCGIIVDNDYVEVNYKYVNFNTVGDYPIYIYVELTTKVVYLHVLEDIPVISGLHDFQIEINSSLPNFIEGISAYDFYTKKDITENIIIDNSKVDITKIGEYQVEYYLKDSQGNETVKSIKVIVQDTTKPEIANCKDLTISVHSDINEEFFWKDIIVTDNSQGNVTKGLDLENLVIDKVGSYPVDYIAIDEAGNKEIVTIFVHIIDNEKPELIIPNNITILLNEEINREFFLNGVVVRDNYDNITLDYVLVDYHLVNTSKAGKYQVLYMVLDSSGNITKKIVEVIVKDNDVPVFNNVNNIHIPVGTKEYDFLENIECVDLTDGNITDKINVYDKYVDLQKVGIYPIVFSVLDSSGNYVEKVVFVYVYDDIAPLIIGVEELTFEVFTNLTKEILIKNIKVQDNYDDDITIDVDFSEVNNALLGTYSITYIVSDSSGNIAYEITKLHIVDTTKPVISGVKDKTVSLNQNIDEAFLLSGITITDNYDQNIIDKVVISGNYDTNKKGTYQITITVTDSSGNVAKKQFMLTVIDPNDKESKKSYTYIY
ncbi:MAG TPA: immunoglobulin-like domain-containing protein, partial [Haloplasmataceae bacterium]